MELCLQNVNRRTAPSQSLIPEDSWVFELEDACGVLSPLSSCDADISVDSTSIVPGDFTIEEGELTPTMKLKRRVVVEKYQEQLDALY